MKKLIFVLILLLLLISSSCNKKIIKNPTPVEDGVVGWHA